MGPSFCREVIKYVKIMNFFFYNKKYQGGGARKIPQKIEKNLYNLKLLFRSEWAKNALKSFWGWGWGKRKRY